MTSHSHGEVPSRDPGRYSSSASTGSPPPAVTLTAVGSSVGALWKRGLAMAGAVSGAAAEAAGAGGGLLQRWPGAGGAGDGVEDDAARRMSGGGERRMGQTSRQGQGWGQGRGLSGGGEMSADFRLGGGVDGARDGRNRSSVSGDGGVSTGSTTGMRGLQQVIFF